MPTSAALYNPCAVLVVAMVACLGALPAQAQDLALLPVAGADRSAQVMLTRYLMEVLDDSEVLPVPLEPYPLPEEPTSVLGLRWKSADVQLSIVLTAVRPSLPPSIAFGVKVVSVESEATWALADRKTGEIQQSGSCAFFSEDRVPKTLFFGRARRRLPQLHESSLQGLAVRIADDALYAHRHGERPPYAGSHFDDR